jgi:hypothetical protein
VAIGREVDAEGKPLERRTKAVATFKINLADRPKRKAVEMEEEAPKQEEEAPVDPGFDPRMGNKVLASPTSLPSFHSSPAGE